MSLPSLLELIPPSAVYRRIALDPRLNALGPWQEAAENSSPRIWNHIWAGLVYATQISAMRICRPS